MKYILTVVSIFSLFLTLSAEQIPISKNFFKSFLLELLVVNMSPAVAVGMVNIL